MKKRLIRAASMMLCLTMFLGACSGGVESSASAAPPADGGESASSVAGSEPVAAGDVVEMRLTHHDPPGSATGQFLEEWAAMVKEKSGGRLIVNIMHSGSLAGPTECLDMMKSGAIEFAWGLQGFYNSLFPMTEVMMLPMMGIETAEQGSASIWELYDTTDYLKEEYSEFKVILLHTNCDSPISLKSVKAESLADLSGKSFRTLAGPPTAFVQKMGSGWCIRK